LPYLSTTEDIDGRIYPKDKEYSLYIGTLTIAANIRKGTMIILHYCLVNSAAALMIALATFSFFRLQQIARNEKPAIVQHI
jgi:hypothetical protein